MAEGHYCPAPHLGGHVVDRSSVRDDFSANSEARCRSLYRSGSLEAVFVSLMVLFIIYGLRSRSWAYVGATIIGIAHALVSAFVYFMPVGPPLAIAVYLTALPALVGLAGAVAVIDARRTYSSPRKT